MDIVHQMRCTEIAEQRHYQPINGISHVGLTARAARLLKEWLERYGNRLSVAQQAALYEILAAYTEMAQGELWGRYAFPLGAGLGKTSTIICWALACYILGYDHISFAVATNRVEQLADLKRDLIDAGVPGDMIGLLHSYGYNEEKAEAYRRDEISELPDSYASEPTNTLEEVRDRPILLITHNRIRSEDNVDELMRFKSCRRDFMIWDESLLAAKSMAVERVKIEMGYKYAEPMARLQGEGSALDKACKYLRNAHGIIMNELERQGTDQDPQAIRLPGLTDQQIQEYREAFGVVAWNQEIEACKGLLDISQFDLGVCNTAGGVIHYEITVPKELDKVVILDASAPIRKLMKMDKSIKTKDKHCKDIVNYNTVTVHQIDHASGRGAMTKAFTLKKAEQHFVKECVHIIKSIPEDQGVLIFTHKHRDVNFRAKLEKDLDNAGVVLDAKMPVTDHTGKTTLKPRICWLTHGNETAHNRYSHCSNIVFVGCLWPPLDALAAQIKGQSDNLNLKVEKTKAEEIRLWEIGYRVHQGICRGACRIIEGQTPRPCNVWLPFRKDDIRDILNEVMPGMVWERYEGKYLVTESKVETIAKTILKYLESQDKNRVTSMKIKRACNMQDIPGTTFTRAIERVVALSEGKWQKKDRGVVNTQSADYYGFATN